MSAPYSSPGPDDMGEGPESIAEVGNTLALRDAPQLPAAVQAAAIAAAEGAKAAVVARFQMAQMQPRDMRKVREEILELCDDSFFAEVALYAKPQGKEQIVGLSIRFAEAYVNAAGNFHNASTVMWDDDEKRIIKVEVTDLQRNNTVPVDVVVEKYVERRDAKGREVLGSRKNKGGHTVYRVRAYEDEILMKQNNMVSKAWRTGVDRLTPAGLKAEARSRIENTLRKASKQPDSVVRLVAAYAEVNVSQTDLEGYLGHPLARMNPDEYLQLRATYKAIQDEETTWERVAANAPAPPQRPVKVRSGGYDDPPKAPAKGKAPAETKMTPEEEESEARREEAEMVAKEGRA